MDRVISPSKINMFEKTQMMFQNYDKFMFMNLNKVESTQFKNIKSELPSEVKFLFAKNKIMKKALEEINENGKFDEVIKMIKNNVIVAFFKDEETATEMYNVCMKHRRNAHARFGDVANEDVIIPPGPTGLPPTKINVFHAAHMNTTIVKGKIELAVSHKLVGAGEIVGISEANLLVMLNIMPFNYGLDILKVFEGKEIYDKKVLAVTQEEVEESFKQTIGLIACISLGTDTLTDASIPYEIMAANAEIKKVAAGVDYLI
ncbi:hypothetical protein NUSPORA_02628 [Nucleospora cyclopteri]